MRWIDLVFCKSPFAAAVSLKDRIRLSDTRENADKNMQGFPTVAACAAFYDESRFSAMPPQPG